LRWEARRGGKINAEGAEGRAEGAETVWSEVFVCVMRIERRGIRGLRSELRFFCCGLGQDAAVRRRLADLKFAHYMGETGRSSCATGVRIGSAGGGSAGRIGCGRGLAWRRRARSRGDGRS